MISRLALLTLLIACLPGTGRAELSSAAWQAAERGLKQAYARRDRSAFLRQLETIRADNSARGVNAVIAALELASQFEPEAAGALAACSTC